jgi:hypothetical protein
MTQVPAQTETSKRLATWAFQPVLATGGPGAYCPRNGDVIYSSQSAYRLKWADAINGEEALRIIQVREVYGLKVRFVLCEASKGRIIELGEHSVSESDFLEFLEHGRFPGGE